MDALDTLVLDQLADRVFRSDRLTDLLAGFLDRSKDAETQRRQRLGRLRAELAETEGAITQLLILVEKRKMDLDDPALAEQLQHQKGERRRLQQEIDLTSAPASSSPLSITPAKLDRLSAAMRAALKQEPSDLQRAYLRMFVNRVMVSRREIRISGPKGALAQSRGR